MVARPSFVNSADHQHTLEPSQKVHTKLEVRDERLLAIIAPDGEVERIATGFLFLEGPIWQPVQRTLIFSDIPGDTMYRWNAAGGLEIYRRPSNNANGNTCDRQGRILTCEHATSRVIRQEVDGSLTVLASHYDGLGLNSPNDIVVHSDGSIYFSDPNFGRRATRFNNVPRQQQLPFQAVFRLDLGTSELTPVADDFDQPNGLCFSLDERRLFVNDSARGHIRVFDAQVDGAWHGGQVWAEVRGEGPGVPDGMKFDAAGHLYCCGPGGIHVFDRDGACLGKVCMPEQTANFCWGDDDLRSLYICATTSLYRLRLMMPGRLAAA